MGNTVAILVRRFPKLSETFILGEIANLVDSGTDVEILSLFEPSDRLQQPAAIRFLDRVTYLNRIRAPAAYAALLLALLRNPAGLISLLRITRHDRHLLRRLGALLLSCRRLGIRHIHAHYVSEPAALAAAAANIRKLKFSISAHAKDIYLTPKEEIADRIARAEFIATCTRHNFDHLRGLTIDHKDRVHLVYHGIDTEQFRPDDAAVPHEPPVLLAVGRFKEKKGFDLLVGACAELVARSIDFRCEIIGYGDQEGRLQSLITRHQLGDKVALCPPIDHAKLRTIYRTATIFVLPCRLTADGDRDGIPNAMLEAMASGLPIVGTSVSGIPEVVTDGANGLLVPPENPQALADAVQRLLRDPQLRHRLGESGRQTVLADFCWERNIAQLVQLLQRSGQRRSFTIRQAQ
jgi:glycosyltransferase involved in cell wall biosynthesis